VVHKDRRNSRGLALLRPRPRAPPGLLPKARAPRSVDPAAGAARGPAIRRLWKSCRNKRLSGVLCGVLSRVMKRVLIPLDLSGVDRIRPAASFVVHECGGATMGTTWSVRLAEFADANIQELRRGIEAELDRVVAQMSTWEPGSDLSRLNRAGPDEWQKLPNDFFHVLQYALLVAKETGGAYDPSAGPLVNVWGFGPDPRTGIPSAEAVERAKRRTGWDRIRLNIDSGAVCHSGDSYIDLSAAAKGYAVDLVARYLRRNGVANYLVEVGGELCGHGMKPDGTPWWVALESPAQDSGAEAIVALHGLSVATSGDYRRYFLEEGVRYSHTIDPRTGYPIDNGVASVTVLHPECMAADALSTALTVLGVDAGLEYASERDLAALFIERTSNGFRERMTPSFTAMLE